MPYSMCDNADTRKYTKKSSARGAVRPIRNASYILYCTNMYNGILPGQSWWINFNINT